MADIKIKVELQDENKTNILLGKPHLKNVESLSQTTDRPDELFYGILPSSGNVEILDVSGELYNHINDGTIQSSNLPITILANGNEIQHHISTETNYNLEDKTLSFDVSNVLEQYSNVLIDKLQLPMKFNLYYGTWINFSNIIFDCFTTLGFTSEEISEMLSNKIIVSNYKNIPSHIISIHDYLANINIIDSTYYIEDKTIGEVLTKICEAAQLQLILDDFGKLKFVSTRCKFSNDTNIINIPKKNQFKVPNRDVFIKNKYDNIEYNYRIKDGSIVNVLSTSYDLKDSDGNSILPNIEGIKYENATLYFFLTVTSSAKVISSNVYYANDKVYPFQVLFISAIENVNDDFIGIESIDEGEYTDTKENFDFSNASYVTRLPYYSTLNSDVFAFKIPAPFIEDNKEMRIHLNLMQVSESEELRILNNNPNILSYDYDNYFMGNTTVYLFDEQFHQGNTHPEELYGITLNHIIKDYSEGVHTSNMQISCSDYYSVNGDKVKQWSNGDVVSVGDVVNIAKENDTNSAFYYSNGAPFRWRVTGRNFTYAGVPKVDLELQETKPYLGWCEFSISITDNILGSSNYEKSDLVGVYINNDLITRLDSIDYEDSTGQGFRFDKGSNIIKLEQKTFTYNDVNYQLTSVRYFLYTEGITGRWLPYNWGDEIIVTNEDEIVFTATLTEV